MPRHFRILLLLLLLGNGLCAQQAIPVSVRNMAPAYGIRPQFLDDTVHIARYLDSLPADNHALTDTCVSLNARFLAFGNNLLYSYRRHNDTVWIDDTHFLDDYTHYTQRIDISSQYIIDRAHAYIEQDHIQQNTAQQSILHQRKDSIDRQHRTIVNACEGIGINDKDRRSELHDIYYAYLSVYNRYDFSLRRTDDEYAASLAQFSHFQQSVIENLLSTNNYTAKINTFPNTLKLRCGHNHSEVLRSYQRAFRRVSNPVKFSNLEEYNAYLDSQQEIIDIQNCYITVVELREQITATTKRITTLYGNRYHDVTHTYQDVASTINTIPAFTTLDDADHFIKDLREFTEVQQCYISDYDRLNAIQQHADSIIRTCALHYSDVSKAYKQIAAINNIVPKYKTLDDAARFRQEIEHFETIQRQFDSIIILRQDIDDARDTIGKGWIQHLTIYNGFQTIRKQHILTPTFIDIEGGSQFIEQLLYFYDIENKCIDAIAYLNESKKLNDQIFTATASYRNIRKAYEKLEKHLLTIKNINHLSELDIYYQQISDYVAIQHTILDATQSDHAADLDIRLATLKDPDKILSAFGIGK